jgi:dTDP-glucose 4,6-dehydratase
VEERYGSQRYEFVHGDICDQELIDQLFVERRIDTVIHLAAESHVDRSILGPREFINTNINGTFSLLEAARKHWGDRRDVLFHHVSTDEVYGSLGDTGAFLETTPYDPRSPYSASKASSDHLVRAYHHTFDLPTVITNCSNNYGPYQFPEKLLPLMILNIRDRKPLPVYGDGGNVRDWLYVDDHSSAIWTAVNRATAGDTFNVGGENEWKNIELVRKLCEIVADELGREPQEAFDLITFVKDRPGHDRRYAIDCTKVKNELN